MTAGPARTLLPFAAAMFAAFASPASAQMVPGTIDCKYDSDLAAYLPKMSAGELKRLEGGSIEICTYSYDGHREAELFAAPRQEREGVCSVQSVDLYLAPDANGHLVESDPPKARIGWADWEKPRIRMMQGSAAPCPPSGDARYIRTTNISPGTFAALFQLWTAIRAAPENFDRLLAVPAGSNPLIGEFRALLADGASRSRLKLVNVFLQPGGQVTAGKEGVGAFKIEIGRGGNEGEWCVLEADWTPQGFRIVGVEMIVS